jgi:protein TonB
MINIRLKHICIAYCIILCAFVLVVMFLNFNIGSHPVGGSLGNNKDYTITVYTADSSSKPVEEASTTNIKKPDVKQKPSEIDKTDLTPKKVNKTTSEKNKSKSKKLSKSKSAEVKKDKPIDAINGSKNLTLVKGGSKEGLGGHSKYPPSYIDKILIYLQRYRYYPPQALKRHIVGTVKVSLVIMCDGELSAYKIIEGSGNKILDDAVNTMLGNTNDFPVNKGCVEPINITVPIEFKMT